MGGIFLEDYSIQVKIFRYFSDIMTLHLRENMVVFRGSVILFIFLYAKNELIMIWQWLISTTTTATSIIVSITTLSSSDIYWSIDWLIFNVVVKLNGFLEVEISLGKILIFFYLHLPFREDNFSKLSFKRLGAPQPKLIFFFSVVRMTVCI